MNSRGANRQENETNHREEDAEADSIDLQLGTEYVVSATVVTNDDNNSDLAASVESDETSSLRNGEQIGQVEDDIGEVQQDVAARHGEYFTNNRHDSPTLSMSGRRHTRSFDATLSLSRIPGQSSIRTPGDLYSFGQNTYGELAHSDTTDRHSPNRVEYIRENQLDIVQVVAGNEHTVILTSEGKVYTCGYNERGQCGQVGRKKVKLLSLVKALENENIVLIHSANGCEHVMAVNDDGKLFSWGYNSRGQLGHSGTRNVDLPKLVQISNNRKVAKVACSYYHSIIATQDDVLYSFGRNDFGQLGIGEGPDVVNGPVEIQHPRSSVVSLACGQYHTLVSFLEHGVQACGRNDLGQLGIGTFNTDPRFTLTEMAPPFNQGSVTLCSQVSCGYYHTVLLTSSGQVYSCGQNDCGQLGLGDTDKEIRAPKIVAKLEDKGVVQVSCGCYHTLFRTDDGKVFATGRNNHGQLGSNSGTNVKFPALVDGLRNTRVYGIAAGFYHSLCLVESHTMNAKSDSHSLSFDLRRLLNCPERSDITFIVEDQPLHAHACILMVRCEPLQKMLCGEMQESRQSTVTIPEVKYNVFLALLEFLYTDSVESLFTDSCDVDFALDLLALADQYLVEPLKQLCEVTIQRAITIDNVCAMFATAHRRHAETLRRTCFDFVLRNFGRVMGTSGTPGGFTDLPPELLTEVCQAAHHYGVYLKM